MSMDANVIKAIMRFIPEVFGTLAYGSFFRKDSTARCSNGLVVRPDVPW